MTLKAGNWFCISIRKIIPVAVRLRLVVCVIIMRHQKFKEKHELPFPLIADVDHTLLEAMGAWGEKNMYGKKTMGTIRTTFIINEEGIIEKIFTGKQIKTKEHATQILEVK